MKYSINITTSIDKNKLDMLSLEFNSVKINITYNHMIWLQLNN